MVTDYYLPTLGGVQTLVKAHKEALEQAGHQVTVFCPQHRNSQLPDPTVVALPTSGVFRPDGYPFTWSPQETTTFLAEQFTARSVDVVHVHSEMVAALGGLLAARQLGIPSVQTMHGRVDVYTKNVLPLPELSTRFLARIHHKRIPHTGTTVEDSQHYTATPLARRMWRLMVAQANYADQVIVPSQHFADKLLAQGVTSPLTVLSNGLEDSVLEAIGPAQLRNYEPGTEFRLTWCGRVSPEKRPAALVQAASEMVGDVVVQMFGDGVATKSVAAQIRRAGLSERVRMAGSVPQSTVIAGMQDSHAFISTSYDFDNQPMVLLEALATGLPVIVADPELGAELPPGSVIVAASPAPGDIAQAVNQLVANPEQLREMSAAAIAHRSQTSQQTHLGGLLQVYQDAVAGPA